MNYQQAVQQNLDHMGSDRSEWTAVPVLSMVETDCEDGTNRVMPQFSFPENYAEAPSMYKGECCNLCGTRIKNVYWIQNDKRRWIMPVGSECVTHFGGGETGAKLVKKASWEQNAELLKRVREVRFKLYSTFRKSVKLGYGRVETKIWPHSPNEKAAIALCESFKACVGKLTEQSGNAAITRWAKKNGTEAQKLVQQAEALLDLAAQSREAAQ